MVALPRRRAALPRRALIALAATGVLGGALTVPLVAAPAMAASETISADSLRAPQVNGTVYSVAIVGNVAYAAGDFTTARPPGALAGVGEVPRTNLLAFSLTTGELLPWAPVVAGTPFSSGTANPGGGFCDSLGGSQWVCDTVFRIKASPDGSRLYVAGDFTSVNGVARYRLAAFDTATGALVTTFKPAASSRVRALAVTENAVYVGGGFTSVSGVAEQRIAAFTPTGALEPGFTASADAEVWAMAASTDRSRVVVGGGFSNLSGAARAGAGTISTADGSPGPWSFQPIVEPGSERTTDIAVDGSTAYLSGASYGLASNNRRWEGRAAADVNTGNLIWYDRCLGDTQGVAVAGGVVYSASHAHDCSAMQVGAFALAPGVGQYQRIIAESTDATGTNTFGEPRPDLLPVFPNTDAGPAGNYFRNGPWTVTTNGTYVVVGGEFTTVNGIRAQGIGRFVLRHLSPLKVAPAAFTSAPSGSSGFFTSGINLQWPSTWDRDDVTLTYDVYRDGGTTPVFTTTQTTYWWNVPTMSWRDTGMTRRAYHTYVVTATDSNGHVVASSASAPIYAR